MNEFVMGLNLICMRLFLRWVFKVKNNGELGCGGCERFCGAVIHGHGQNLNVGLDLGRKLLTTTY